MELYSTLDKFIIHNKDKNQSLWCCKLDGSILPRPGKDFKHAWNPVCQGIVYGVIGKLQIIQGSEHRLLVVSDRRSVGFLPGGHEVFKIEKVAFITLSVDSELECELLACSEHQKDKSEGIQQKAFQQTWNSFKSTATNQFKGIKGNLPKELKDREKLEKRLLEEMFKMFNETGSFYYSLTGDITNTMQRLYNESINKYLPIWDQVDERFFWNKYMLDDLINSKDQAAKHWILPIMQGHFEVERCSVDILDGLSFFPNRPDDSEDSSSDEEDGFMSIKDFRTGENLKPDEYDIVLISRRSRHRAGTRYKRRGVDMDGNCANYVETEQIVCVMNHFVSFVQVRGSVPVFWSQPGYKYRPPPLIDKDETVTQEAFAMHFNGEISKYRKQVIINLVEQTGREKIIGDAFVDNILKFDSPDLKLINFDFHEYCRGMKFQNVAILIDNLTESLKEMRYCWVDDNGMVADQRSAFRVNCMDCLDRTNVVQATIARVVLETLLLKLGRMLPEHTLPHTCRRIHNHIWANNGDAISRQYAGTAAMKGDFTRTGERKITGLMKDGYKSANRYYLNRFRDTHRQAIIDIMLGNPVSDDFMAIAAISKSSTEDETWTSDREECLAQLVLDSQKILLPAEEEFFGGWALVDPFTFSGNEEPQDEDVVLLLTNRAYYVGRYEDTIERLISYERIPITDLEKIEIGSENNYFKGNYCFMRLYHRFGRSSGYFHTVRTVQNRKQDETRGILLSIAEMFLSTCKLYSFNLRVVECNLDKRRTKRPPKVIPLSSKKRLSSFRGVNLPDIDQVPTSKEGMKPVGNQDRPVQLATDSPKRKPSSGMRMTQIAGHEPEYETWISMGPEGEIVERRRLNPISKSSSDTELNMKCKESSKSSKIDFVLNKTKSIFSNEKSKKPEGPAENKGSTMDDASASWSPSQMDGKEGGNSPRFSPFSGSALKAPLKDLHEKIKVKLEKITSFDSNGSQDDDSVSKSSLPSSRLRFLTDVRSRFGTSPKPRKKMTIYISPEETERRNRCKTEIIDL